MTAGGTEGEFAYQAIAGAAFPLTQWGVPGLSLTAEYRFFGTLEPSFNARLFSTATGVDLGGAKLQSQNLNHSVLLGLRYAFNQPAPPPPAAAPVPPPAPPPQVARTYLVFFDWDRADLTARAREIISEAAQNARRVQTTRIEVAGHADRSGTPQYNMRLSRRRAETVAVDHARDAAGAQPGGERPGLLARPRDQGAQRRGRAPVRPAPWCRRPPKPCWCCQPAGR
ncbi:MAG: OmpA family protein [Acetobacteraceae bacterium]|nr:OmpA family protein [Acetobacteraceae bacterium]